MDIIVNLLFTSIFLTFVWIIVSVIIDNSLKREAEILEEKHPKVIKYVLGVPLLVFLVSDMFFMIVLVISVIWFSGGCV